MWVPWFAHVARQCNVRRLVEANAGGGVDDVGGLSLDHRQVLCADAKRLVLHRSTHHMDHVRHALLPKLPGPLRYDRSDPLGGADGGACTPLRLRADQQKDLRR